MVAILHIPAQPIDPYRLGRDPLPFKDLTRIGYRMSKEAKIKYRLAVEQDVPTILWLIKLFGEDQLQGVNIGEKDLISDGFGAKPYFQVILAELTSSDTTTGNACHPPSLESVTIGCALYFFLYSTSAGGRVLCLEDLFITSNYRNKGYGTELFKEMAKITEANDCVRMIWDVWDWNTKAMALYKRIGGTHDPELLDVRLDRPSLCRLATSQQNSETRIHFRQVTEKDLDVLLGLMQEILDHFNYTTVITKEDLLRDGFGTKPCFEAILAEVTSSAGVKSVIGYVLYCYTYTAWEGRVLCLEDIYVRGKYRGKGYGTSLMRETARIAMDGGCCRVIWQVLQSNTKAKNFYERIGAKFVPELLNMHMEIPICANLH